MLLSDSEAAASLGMQPKLKWLGSASAGVDPGVMGYGPVPSTEKLLKRLGLSLDDIGSIEFTEAFAAQAIACMRPPGLDHDKLNVNGGAIAMGHPLGATGAMILGTMVDELERANKETALVTLCIGGGMGIATIIERV